MANTRGSGLLAFALSWLLLCPAPRISAAPPPDLPGDDITEDYARAQVPQDTVLSKAPSTTVQSATWLDQAMKTWDAPPLAQQIMEDETPVPMGMGALFVPRMGQGELEPDIEVLDSLGAIAARGKPGQKLSVLPGPYYAMLGSGAHRQRMVRKVVVEENKTTPVIPEWGGLSISIVDENGVAFRGEYELARIDRFEPYGRSYGADPNLGEEPKTWLLEPGIYKVFGVGETYNTLRNFVTVQILPGRMVKFLLVENNANDTKIISGGIVDVKQGVTLASVWKYGLDLGGSALFNATVDRLNRKDSKNSISIILLLNAWLRYRKDPVDWYTNVRINEGFSMEDFSVNRLENSADDVRLTSLLIWRFLHRFGPYGRFETQVDVFPKQKRRQDNDEYFYIVDKKGRVGRSDTSSSIQTEAAFSPFNVETGLGANVDMLATRFVDLKARGGFGYSYKQFRNKLTLLDAVDIIDSLRLADSAIIARSEILQDVGSSSTNEAGPEAALLLNLRLGSVATAGAELKVFAPVAPEMRLLRPDFNLETTLSWRLARAVTLDYVYTYLLRQPSQKDLKADVMGHAVRIRYSFTSR